MSFSPVLLIIFILVGMALTLFFLLYFKKIQKPSVVSATKNQAPTLPPIKPESSPWIVNSKTSPLDPVLPPPGNAGCPVCQLYTFGSSKFQISQPNLRELPDCVDAGTCKAEPCPPATGSTYPTCNWPDQAFAFMGYHVCGTSQVPNAAGTCITQTGQAVPPGYKETYYDSCLSNNPTCNKNSPNMTMDLVMINWDYGGMTPSQENPLSKFFCMELENITTNTINWEICNIGANFIPTQVWIITRYSYDTINLVADPTGPLMSIMNRDTGKYLIPKGFTPNSVPAWVASNIPAGNKTLELDLYQTPTGEINPGVWWALYTSGMYPPYIDFPCPGESSYQCKAATQLVFIPDYTLIPSSFLPAQLISYLTSAYSINVTQERDDISENFTYNGNGTWTMTLKNMGSATAGTSVLLRQFYVERNLTNPDWTQPPVTVNTFLMDYSQYPNYVKASQYNFADPT